MTPEQCILKHAQRFLGKLGNVEVRNVRREGECYSGNIILTTPETIEHYRAWVQGGAIGMGHVKTVRLPKFAEG